jgi:3-dehydroquinate synthase
MKIKGKNTGSEQFVIVTGENVFTELDKFLRDFNIHPVRTFILVDENTRHHCLPVLLSRSEFLKNSEIIEIPSGEKNKSIGTAIQLWNALMTRHADRHSLLINLGGGVISDLGGFIASTFQRGIPYINLPTTLMGQVDAAIGGKTGLNFSDIKNQIGTFYNPKAVFVHTGFLKTLHKGQIANGFAEVIKYALIEDAILWKKLENLRRNDRFFKIPSNDLSWEELVDRSINIKYDIIEKDFHEQNLRKLLNFGHTFGHALEALSMKNPDHGLDHGHAIAMGIILESYLSFKKAGLTHEDLTSIVTFILSNYEYFPIEDSSSGNLIEFMAHDKKNRDQKICFTLLQRPGKAIIDQWCDNEMIHYALKYYHQLENQTELHENSYRKKG